MCPTSVAGPSDAGGLFDLWPTCMALVSPMLDLHVPVHPASPISASNPSRTAHKPTVTYWFRTKQSLALLQHQQTAVGLWAMWKPLPTLMRLAG